jgi:hypothetical protein
LIHVKKENGKLDYQPTHMDAAITALTDGDYLLEFTPIGDNIHHAQRKFYRGVVLPAFAVGAAGGSYSASEWHQVLVLRFLSKEIDVDGIVYTVPRSTANGGGVTHPEFDQYVQQVILYGQEYHSLVIEPLVQSPQP